MKITINQFLHETNNSDKLLIILIFLFPFLLSTSIFLADLFASFCSYSDIFNFLKKTKKYFHN